MIVINIYILFITMSVLLIMIDSISKRKRRFKRFQISKKDKTYNIVELISDKLIKIGIVKQYIIKCTDKLILINKKTLRENEGLVVSYLIFTIVFSIIISIIFLRLFTMWYMAVVSCVSSFFIFILAFFTHINRKLTLLYSQFPEAIQLFVDEYVICKNIKMAIDNSYKKMPVQISYFFENLSRELSSNGDHVFVFRKFAKGINYIWGYSFCEMLILSYEGAGDICHELISFYELISEGIREDEETAAAVQENKSVFIIVNIITLIAFIINIFYNPFSNYIYFYTLNGNMIIITWIATIFFGFAFMELIKRM